MSVASKTNNMSPFSPAGDIGVVMSPARLNKHHVPEALGFLE